MTLNFVSGKIDKYLKKVREIEIFNTADLKPLKAERNLGHCDLNDNCT